MIRHHPKALALAIAAAFPLATLAEESPDTIVVTAPPMSTPLSVSFDPRTAQQPLPANDGASLLKTIPGMNVIRKGGTDGDPVFRGMAASRLNILLDGEQILGGCGMRMDPPTAYIFPDAYEKVTLLKGPQSVIHGAGASAGTVLFERKPTYYAEPGWSLNGSVTGASFGRHDELLDLKGGNANGYVRGIVTNSASDDYKDGDGKTVHSRYKRNSSTAILGLTPDRDTRLEFSATRSDAEAAYGDRTMDGSKFERSNYGLKFAKERIGGLVDKVEAQLYYNYIDHVMDNYSMRKLTGTAMAKNPDRTTTGGRIAVTLLPGSSTQLVLGADQQSNIHTLRTSGKGGETAISYLSQPRTEDANFDNVGVFAELKHFLNHEQRVVAGLRSDRWQAEDKRRTIGILTGTMTTPVSNPTANASRTQTLSSGFARYEQDFGGAGTTYVGLGHSERAPDYWELFSKEGTTSTSAFDSIKTEKTNQLDGGITWNSGPLQSFVSAFYNRIDDYVLIQSNYAKPGRSPLPTIARNIDATTWGGEAGANYAFTTAWKGMASLAYVRGNNDTDDRALGQIPPLEVRLGLNWDNGTWSAGSLLRLVSRQDRYSVNEGNIVGQDFGATGGFGVFSVNGAYRWKKSTQIAFGVDNLFDKTYAESISRSGAAIMGYEQIARMNEPGRAFWLRARIALD
ncbi:TonB-dependent copper receptor [Rhodocyclus purpureus]|uniref:TonB-dependent copper receptor n=1 Tax=Rhodocyclus purpureus TaxID=1067 RepID=UPI0019120877|nr:TonB-dependent copper receptor [Rhodocyclus purpureus]MBK5914697.1 TonB-dependent copper receptor [Rhodocyclus purpureus]